MVDRDGPATETAPDEMPGPIAKMTVPATDRGWRATAIMTMTTIGTNRAAHAAVLRASVRAMVNVVTIGDRAFSPRSATDRRDLAHGMRAGDVTMVIAGRDHGSAVARAASRIAVQAAMDEGSTVHRVVGPHPLPLAADAALIGAASAALSRRFGVAPLRLPHMTAVVPTAAASAGSSPRFAAAHPRSRLAVVPIIGRRSAVTGDVARSRRVMDVASVVPVLVAATKLRSSAAVPSQIVAVHRHSGAARHEGTTAPPHTAAPVMVGMK